MGDVARAGRTVILVSHQLTPIRMLCQRVAWLDGGSIRDLGSTANVVNLYEANARIAETMDETSRQAGPAQFLRWEIGGRNSEQRNVLDSDSETCFKFVLKVNEDLNNVHHGIVLYNQDREIIWGNSIDGLNLKRGLHELVCNLPYLPLKPGVYNWRVSIYDNGERVDDWDCLPPMFVATVPQTHKQDEFAGILNIPSVFTNRRVENRIEAI